MYKTTDEKAKNIYINKILGKHPKTEDQFAGLKLEMKQYKTEDGTDPAL